MTLNLIKYRTALACGVWLAVAATARTSDGPQPAAPAPQIARPQDRVFDGMVTLAVDATDTRHKIFAVHETIPVHQFGTLTLLYPEWEAGSHAATASVAELAGLEIHAAGKSISWHRDPVDVHAFHVDVPAGTRAIDIDFEYLTRAADAVLRPDLIAVQWHRMLLYPAGWFARNIGITASLTLPPGLHAFTSLDLDRADAATITFKPTTIEMLTDSPVYAGRYWREIDLATGDAAPVRLDLVADMPASLAIDASEIARMRGMAKQTQRLFGAGRYRRYDAIVSLSDALSPGGGIEHLQSSENNLPATYFTDLAHQLNNRDLIAHEYAHSWNGRFRQPADLWTPTLNVPMRDSLLWVYEGQTEYWGRVLAARSGLRTRQETLDKLALDAAIVAGRNGRAWKSLADSNNDPLYMAGHSVVWRDWQRREDYYPEGVLLWLDIDALLREKSGGRKSLDDFARAFFGGRAGSLTTSTYTFEDVCAELAKIAPFDWQGYFTQRLDTHDDAAMLDGLTRHGWRLIYSDTPTETFRQDEAEADAANFTYSIGLTVNDSGRVRSVAWKGSAFGAGLAPGALIASVNGLPYSRANLEAAIRSAATLPITLAYEADGETRIATLSYRGTLRYPHLERIAGRPDTLDALLTPRS